MTTLVLSSGRYSAEKPLANAALNRGWNVAYLDESPDVASNERILVYVDTSQALTAVDQFDLALLEPPLDLLCRLPQEFLNRNVQFARFADLAKIRKPTFVKPADPLNKAFDAGIYSDVRAIRMLRPLPADLPVLLAEPVHWLTEYRCFVLENRIVATSPYLSFARPVWKPYGQGGELAVVPQPVLALCERLLQSDVILPPGCVVDIGMIEDRGWSVVEFNPAWCAGLLGANPDGVLDVLQRTCIANVDVSEDDRVWQRLAVTYKVTV